MNFKRFSEFREFIRRYNSTSILEVGTAKCWQNWESISSASLSWVHANTQRNHVVRIMLLASAGNPHRKQNINAHEFDRLVDAYHNWGGHTIADQRILEEEARILLESIQGWETHSTGVVRNWSLKLSEVLNLSIIRPSIKGLFLQRSAAFQNAGFGYPIARLWRTLKLIDFLDDQSDSEFSRIFSAHMKLNPTSYFRQYLACLALFGWFSERRGFCNFSQIPDIDAHLQELGISEENIKAFVRQNSALFSSKSDTSFRSKVSQTLDGEPEYYQPFFYNQFLEIPFVGLSDKNFCLPDPLSFAESCWNQVRKIIYKDNDHRKKLGQALSRAFEDYLERVLLPVVCPSSFERIPEVKNPSSNKDKRADFLVETQKSYVLIECKSCVMHSDTSAYFQADKIADLWCRIHCALEQISMTVKARNLCDRPVIPLILTFYDSIAASTIFEEVLKRTDYCSRMELSMPPIVYSLHEFEHWISNRSLDNWSELILAIQGTRPFVVPDNKGHKYEHLKNISIL